MKALANYIMRGPIQAMLVTAAFGVISIAPILGILGIFSGGAVALVTLRQGVKQGFTVLLGSCLIASLFISFVLGSALPGIGLALFMWLPALVLALVLRNTTSWSITLDGILAIGLLFVVAFYAATGDPSLWWQQVLNKLLDSIVAETPSAEVDFNPFREQLSLISQWMTSMVVAALAIALVASMMLARWWQAMLYNPGGFRQEFYTLRISRIAAYVVVGAMILSALNLGVISALVGDLAVIAVVVYSVIGLGIAHALVAKSGRNVGWLVVLYVAMLFVTPHVMVMLAGLAVADSWLNFRARLEGKGPPGPEQS